MDLVILIWIIIAVAIIQMVIILKGVDKGKSSIDEKDKKEIIDAFSQNINVISTSLTNSAESSAKETKNAIDGMRQSLSDVSANMELRLKTVESVQEQKLEAMRKTIDSRLETMNLNNDKHISEIKELTNEKFTKTINEKFTESFSNVSSQLKREVEILESNVKKMQENNDKRLFEIKDSVNEKFDQSFKRVTDALEREEKSLEISVKNLQENNDRRLSEMQQIVDEKLSKTLNDRFKDTFEILSKQLESVHTTMGEMRQVSTDVNSLSKVLSNVKTTGIFGEIQLGAIIEQILTPEQYIKNVATSSDTRDVVEFAVKLPGQGDEEVLLPIDSKFPYTVYTDMQSAYENNNFDEFEKKRKELFTRIRSMAKDISTKYINVPKTTNFAIMFLPIEGLYAEIVKGGLISELQREFKITVAGPTTMSALLNSFQMGFQTLAIQKKSGDVWKILSNVKSEFEKFNGIIEKVQKKLVEANTNLDQLVGVRARAIDKQLRNVTTLEEIENKN